MSFPAPRPGLVVRYSYLWADEHAKGREEGTKDRPCAIVAARRLFEGGEIVTVVPVTHSRPDKPEHAIEIPAALKAYLGLDGQASWVIINETNDFVWPGPDLRPIAGTSPPQYAYGMLPPRFYAYLRDRLLQANHEKRLKRVPRTK